MAADANDLSNHFSLHFELAQALANTAADGSSNGSDGAATPSRCESRSESRCESLSNGRHEASRSFRRRPRGQSSEKARSLAHRSWSKVLLSWSTRWRDELTQILKSSGYRLREEGQNFQVENQKGERFTVNKRHLHERPHFPLAVFVKLGKPAWQDLRPPVTSRCGRTTRVAIDPKDGHGPDRIPGLRPLREARWPMLDIEPHSAALATKVEQRGFLVDELQDFIQRSCTCACDALRGLKLAAPEAVMSEEDLEVARQTFDIRTFENDTAQDHLQVQAGLRCMKPRCPHCAGHCSCSWKDPMRELIEFGADVNGRDWKGRTALLLAAGLGHVRMVTFLLDAHADPLLSCDPDGWTPLHEAVSRGRPGVCDALLEAVSPNQQPLLEARVRRHREHMKATAALVAAATGHVDSLQVLINYRANIDARQEDGSTPLMLAAEAGHSKVCRLLVRSGCLVCGGPGAAQRRTEIDAGRPLSGCRGTCRDRLHVPLRNKKGESPAMIARHNLRQHFRFLETSLFLESKGIR